MTQTLEIRTDSPDKDALLAMGEVTFLAARCAQHAGLSLRDLRHWWEMPILTRQNWVFRVGDVPRAAVSWAALSPEAEHRYIVKGEALRPEDWRGGRQVWVIDWIAPFQLPDLNKRIRKWMVTDGFKDVRSVRFARMAPTGRPRTLIELQRDPQGKMSRKILSPNDFTDPNTDHTASTHTPPISA